MIRNVAAYFWILLLALIGPVAMELLAVQWFAMAPATLDVLGNYLWFVILPVLFIITGSQALCGAPVFLKRPYAYPIHCGVFLVVLFLWLRNFHNPVSAIAEHAVVALCLQLLIAFVFFRRPWRS